MKTHAQPTPPPKTRPQIFATRASITLALIALLATLTITACEPRVTDDSSSASASGDTRSQNAATINGRLASAVGNVARAQIIVFHVQPDGTLQDISLGNYQTDDEGRFEALARVDNPPLSNVIIEARTQAAPPSTENSADQKTKMPTRLASALLISPLNPGETTKSPTLNFETTLEADLYTQARKLALWDDALCDQTQLRIAITPQIARALRASGDYDAQVAILARLTTTAMRAFTATLLRNPAFEDRTTHEGRHEIEPGFRHGGIRKAFSKEDIQKARTTFHNDVEKYDQQRDDPDSNSTDDRTRRALSNALVQSYLDNNINIHVLASANQAASEAALALLPQLAPETRAAVMSNIEVQRARFITRAIQDDFSTLGGPGESSTAVEKAGVTLRTELARLSERTDDITNDVHTLWQQYRQRVEEVLQTTFTAQQRQVVEQMQSDIVPATRTMFNTIENLTPDSTSEDIASNSADAVLLFHKDTAPLAYSEMWKNADIPDKRATAILDILLNFATIR